MDQFRFYADWGGDLSAYNGLVTGPEATPVCRVERPRGWLLLNVHGTGRALPSPSTFN
jgi:hypothetical protein